MKHWPVFNDFAGAILQKRQNRGSRHTTDKDELLGVFQLQPHGREVKLESRALLKNVKAEIHGDGVWCVPKQDLVTGLRVMLEKRELGLPATFGASRALVKELAEMETWTGGRGGLKFGARRDGTHDDLVMASALACWRARRRQQEIWGTKSLGF